MIEPVVFYNGFVLDGWHRLRAAEELGLKEFPTAEYSGRPEDIEVWLAARNEHRRHLSDMQFAMMVAAKGTKSQGLTAVNPGAIPKKTHRVKTDKQLAAENGIQPNMLSTARKVLASEDDELIEAARGGSIGRTEARKRLRELEAQRLADEQLASASPARSDVVGVRCRRSACACRAGERGCGHHRSAVG